MRIILICFAVLLLVSPVLSLFPPVPETGVVYDAATHLPLAGVVVTAHVQGVSDSLHPEFAFDAHHIVTVTDSLGRYSAGYLNSADVVFVAAGYDTLKLKWPDDLEQPTHEPCDLRLIDVFLVRTEKATSLNGVPQPPAPPEGNR